MRLRTRNRRAKRAEQRWAWVRSGRWAWGADWDALALVVDTYYGDEP